MPKLSVILSFSLFFLVGLAITFGANYLLYHSVVRFFKISSLPVKHYLFIVAVILAVSFIAAEVLARWGENNFIRIFYLAANVWLGILVNLLLAVLLVWLVEKISNFFTFNLNTVATAAFFFILAVVFSIYGIWNAFNPRVKNLEIKINNLPAAWQGKTVVQLSDVHLGNIHRVSFLENVVEKTNALKPDLIVITGDLFDGMDGDLSVFIDPLNRLQAKEGIYFVTGNHETYLGLDKVLAILAKTKIRVLRNETVELDGLQLVGLDYTVFSNSQNVVKNLISAQPNFIKGAPTILLYHIPADIKQAQAAGVSLQLSGHTHHGQIFPVQFFEWLIYGKYYYGLHQDGSFSIYTSSGVGTWGPPMRTGNVPEIVAIKLE